MMLDEFGFNTWVGCQRLFNVTPTAVWHAGDAVRFLATVHDVLDVADSYVESALIAMGCTDEEGDDRIIAAHDTFRGQPCVVVARAAMSYLEDDRQSLEVTVYLDSNDDTIAKAIADVKAASREEHFELMCHGSESEPDLPDPPVEVGSEKRRSFTDWLLGRKA